MLSKTGRFRRADRILLRRDFKRAVKSGRRRVSGSFIVVTASRDRADVGTPDEQRRRLGVTVSKRVGNAVIRNRIKRGIREWFRAARGSLSERSDFVVIARRSARELSGVEIARMLDRAVRRPEEPGCKGVVVGIE